MKKYFSILILSVVGSPLALADISVQNDQKYIDNDGILHIVGEINNESDIALTQIKIHALLYSESNQIINDATSSTLVNHIMPGMKAPFDIIIIQNNAQDIKSYTLSFDYQVTKPKSQVIGITSSELSRNSLDNFIITGTVSNNGEITANTVSIIATLYDKHGNVAAVSKIQTEPDYLRSFEEMFFLIPIQDKIQTDTIVDYSLVAESEEYAAVPEFTIDTIILLASVVFGYIMLTKYWNRTITNVVAAADLR